VATPVNLILNAVLIPKYGASGAALATAVSFFIVLAGSVIMADRALRAAVALHERLAAQPLSPAPARIH
jgi:O-antigen/teichoic acid export membrane protein